jgi:hypothetical protein
MPTCVIPLLLLTGIVTSPPQQADPPAKQTQDAPKAAAGTRTLAEFEATVRSLLSSRQFVSAARAVADYELALMRQYPQSEFRDGVFTCYSHNLTFQCKKSDWHIAASTAECRKSLPLDSPIADPLVLLTTPQGKAILSLICMDSAGVRQRTEGGPRRSAMTDQDLEKSVAHLTDSLGAATKTRWATLGRKRFVLRDVTTVTGEPAFAAACAHEGRTYAFLLAVNDSNLEACQGQLMSLLETLSFAFSPRDATKIGPILAALPDPAQPEQIADCVHALAEIGEYRTAAETLAGLYPLIGQQIGQPVIRGDTAMMPAYRLKLENPDPKQWKLSIQPIGGMSAILLRDVSSVNEAGIMIAVFDPTLMFGRRLSSGSAESDELRKNLLVGAGRGAVRGIGGEILDESYVDFKNTRAYQVSARPLMPRLRVQGLMVDVGEHFLMIIMLLDDKKVDNTSAAWKTLLEKHLDIGKQ